jgi:hypothetical protein
MLRAIKHSALLLATSAAVICVCVPYAGGQSVSIRFERSSASPSDHDRGKPIAKALPARALSRIRKAVASFAFSPVLPEKGRARFELQSGIPVTVLDSEGAHLLLAYSSLSDRAPPVLS